MGHTRKRSRHLQNGRGAVVDGDSTFPVVIVQKVLGVGGYGLVTGLPRMPFKSEMADYTRLGLATHIGAVIEENIPKDNPSRYKEFCEAEIAKVSDPVGKALLQSLCFEVTKLFLSMEDDTTEHIWSHIATHRGLSLYTLVDEVKSIAEAIILVKSASGSLSILEKVSVYPDESIIYDLLKNIDSTGVDKYLSSMLKQRDTGVVKMNSDKYTDLERLTPDLVCLPSMSEIPEYLSPRWIENFGQKMKFFMNRGSILRDELVGLDSNGIVEWTIQNLVGMPFPLAKQDINGFLESTDKSLPGITRAIASPTLSFLENMFDFYGLGIVHNDFKGGNAMVTLDDEIKFIDFGAVKPAGELTEKLPFSLEADYQIWSPLNPLRAIADEYIPRMIDKLIWKNLEQILEINYGKPARDVREMYTRHADTHGLESDYRTLYNSTKPKPGDDPSSDKAKTSALLKILNSLPHMAYKNFTYIDNTVRAETENYIGLQFVCFRRIFIKILKMKGIAFADTEKELKITDSSLLTLEKKEELRKEVVSELALRNDVFSVGLVLYEIANLYGGALAKTLERTGKSFDIRDKECLMLIGLLTLAGICTSIMVDSHHSEWLPDLKEYVGRLKRLLAGEDVTIVDLKPTERFVKISPFDSFAVPPPDDAPAPEPVAEASMVQPHRGGESSPTIDLTSASTSRRQTKKRRGMKRSRRMSQRRHR